MGLITFVNLYNQDLIEQAEKTGIIPAGWYKMRTVGAHEDECVDMTLISLNRDEPRENLPNFTYWEENVYIDNNYRLSPIY